MIAMKKLYMQRTLAILNLLFGVILLTYMTIWESEPGALPLLLVIIATIWLWSTFRSGSTPPSN
jgi:hypothetical protein